MKFIKGEEAVKFVKDEKNVTIEYDFQDQDINLAVSKIKGRFPKSGYAVNRECKEMVLVLAGSGKIFINDEVYEFQSDDAFLINKGEKYYYEANCVLCLPCTPAWNKEQHEIIEREN